MDIKFKALVKLAFIIPLVFLAPQEWVQLWFEDKKTLMKEIGKVLGIGLIILILLGAFVGSAWYSYHACTVNQICPETMYVPHL